MSWEYCVGAFMIVAALFASAKRIKTMRELTEAERKDSAKILGSIVGGILHTAVTAFLVAYGAVLVVRHWP